MKVNDTVPVFIAGHEVAKAKVVAVDTETVTLIVPGTKVVMGVRVELGDLPNEPVETGAEHQLLGVDVETPSAEVVETPPNDTNVLTVENAPVDVVESSTNPPTVETPDIESPKVDNE